MPLILGTNSIKDTGFNVANSLRFNSGSSDYLTKSNGSGSTTKATISVWVKHTFGSSEDIFQSFNNSENAFRLRFRDTGEIELTTFISDSTILDKRTTAVFRDPSAWMHICVIINLSDGTAEDKVQLYVNGSRVTSFVVNTNTSATSGAWVGGSSDFGFTIGRNPANSNYYNGYISEFVFIDNNNLAADQFGEFDSDSGIWKPIDVSGLTFGTNGFYLDFENSGSLGADVSGNGNNFTVNNLTAIDQSTDTCTNNFATWNPLKSWNRSGTIQTASFDNGNLRAIFDDANYNEHAWSTIGINTGKWFCEMKAEDITATSNTRIGIADIEYTGTANPGDQSSTIYYMGNGQKRVGGTNSSYGASYANGDIIGIALDCDNDTVTFYKNGASQGVLSSTNGILYAFISEDYQSSGNKEIQANFGSPAFAISSGNSDANGYGNFEYAVPSGYYALNTKNLAEYG